MGGTETLIGAFKTASECTTSQWGDDHMFIRHERMDDDLALKPEWEQYTPKYTGIFNGVNNDPKCPFADLLEYLQ